MCIRDSFAPTPLSAGADPAVEPDRQASADGLEDLHQDDQHHHRDPEDDVHAALVAQIQRHGAQSAAADGAGHGAVAEDGDKRLSLIHI